MNIQAGEFDLLPNLMVLDVNNNYITSLDSEAFINNTNLTVFEIENNYLNLAGDDAVEIAEIESMGITFFV